MQTASCFFVVKQYVLRPKQV